MKLDKKHMFLWAREGGTVKSNVRHLKGLLEDGTTALYI